MQSINKKINEYTKIAQNNINNYLVVMVSNVKNITQDYTNYTEDSITSEYYSYAQYEEILTTLRECGFEVVCYFDENTFITEYLSGRLQRKEKEIIVLNSSQTGIGSGRKSLIPAFCELNAIIHTNSDSFISTYTRQKYHWYCFLKEGNYPVAESWLYHCDYGWYYDHPSIGEKVLLKLNREASSIGLSEENILIYDVNTDKKIKKLSELYSQPVIVQKFISGYEVEVPCLVLDNFACAFEPTGIQVNSTRNLGNRILDYNIRGEHFFSFYDFKEFNSHLASKIKEITEDVAIKMSLFGMARIDFRIDKESNIFITDISSNPHITKSMTFYYLYKKLGYSYEDVLLTLLGMTIQRSKND